MTRRVPRRAAAPASWLGIALLCSGCTAYEFRHEIGWHSSDQIWLAEPSQVALRAAQSRIFDTTDRLRTLEAVVATFQDTGFQIEVLDEVLGIVSGKKFVDSGGPAIGRDPYYHLYDDESLLAFTRVFRSWGPFRHRSDLVRLTVTVRRRNETQLVVRASAQYFLRAVEVPGPYQDFFAALQRSLFLEATHDVP